MSFHQDEVELFDLSDPRAVRNWQNIDDTVMGGHSRSSAKAEDGALIFSGNLSLEGGGGFCSIRSAGPELNLSHREGIAVHIMTDDRAYILSLRNEPGRDVVVYQHPLPTHPQQWVTVHALFADFEPTWHGEIIEDAPPLNLSRLQSVGFVISDGREGPFRLQVASIQAFGAA
ncbi:MAG: CIA30 family protein [candidate division WS1 bacterium]|nr:CIA30 family protein [candidate division WS1 bacterium]